MHMLFIFPIHISIPFISVNHNCLKAIRAFKASQFKLNYNRSIPRARKTFPSSAKFDKDSFIFIWKLRKKLFPISRSEHFIHCVHASYIKVNIALLDFESGLFRNFLPEVEEFRTLVD